MTASFTSRKRLRPEPYIGLDSSNRFCPVLDEKQQALDPLLNEPIPRDRLIRLDVNGQLQCYDILTLKRIVDTQPRPVEPFSNIPLGADLIQLIRQHPAEYTAEHKESIEQGNAFRQQEMQRYESELFRQPYALQEQGQQHRQQRWTPYGSLYSPFDRRLPETIFAALNREAQAEAALIREAVENRLSVLIHDGIIRLHLPESRNRNFSTMDLARKIHPERAEVDDVLITSPYLLSVLPEGIAGQPVNLVYDQSEDRIEVYSSAAPSEKLVSFDEQLLESVDPTYLHQVHFRLFLTELSEYSIALARYVAALA